MKRNHKASVLILAFALAALIAGCGGSKSSKAAYLDYMNSIELGSTLEDVNALVGSEGVVSEKSETVYAWTFERGKIEVSFNYTGAYEVELVEYETEDVTNGRCVIKDLNPLKAKVEEGITYDEFKKYLGGVDGVLITKYSGYSRYIWQAPDGGYVKGSFNANNECTFFTGVWK